MLGGIDFGVRWFGVFLSIALAGCSSVSETAPTEVEPAPLGEGLLTGMNRGIADSHFAPPIEVTDPVRAPAISSFPWMVCIRSATSDEAKRQTYSAFFAKGAYVSSRYSVYSDNCNEQQFHPLPPPSPPPKAPPPAKQLRR